MRPATEHEKEDALALCPGSQVDSDAVATDGEDGVWVATWVFIGKSEPKVKEPEIPVPAPQWTVHARMEDGAHAKWQMDRGQDDIGEAVGIVKALPGVRTALCLVD